MYFIFSCCYSVPTLQQNKDSQKWQYHIELIFKMKKWWHCLNHVQYLISAFIGNSILKQLYYIHYLSTIQDFLIIMYRLICEMSYSLFDKDWHNIPIYIKQTSFISYAITRNCVIRPKLWCYSSYSSCLVHLMYLLLTSHRPRSIHSQAKLEAPPTFTRKNILSRYI